MADFITKKTFKDTVSFEPPNTTLLTVQGQAYSVRDMLIRQSNGLPLSKLRMPYYRPESSVDDIDLESVQRMDLTEREELLQEQKTVTRQKQEQLKQQAHELKEVRRNKKAAERQAVIEQAKKELAATQKTQQ